MKDVCLIFTVLLASLLICVDCRPASRECHDKFQNCETWRRSGFCAANSHVFYLRNGCAKTCGFCKENAPASNTLHSVQDALQAGHEIGQKIKGSSTSHNQNKAATADALHKRREHEPPRLTKYHKSLDEKGEEKPDCTDRFVTETCANWKNGEICMDDRYRKYLTYGCAMTCRFCNCRDTYRESPYCDEWKSRGFCDTYKEQLDTYCPKTCGFCVNAKYEETTTPVTNATTEPKPSQNATSQPTPSQNATTEPTPSQNATSQPTPSKNATTEPTPSQNATAQTQSSQNEAVKLPSLGDKVKSPDIAVTPVKGVLHRQSMEFAETGNLNSKRGFPEENSPLWSVNADTRLTLPQPQQYDDMGGAVRHPLEDGTYFTPAKTSDKFEYYTEHYSPDPYVAAAQREEWMTQNTGNGVSPSPKLSRKSESPEVKREEETITVLKKSKIKHAKHAHKKKH